MAPRNVSLAKATFFFNNITDLPKLKHKQLRDKILNILGLLSESLMRRKDLFYDAQEIWEELVERGFSEVEIEQALMHIEDLTTKIPGPFWSEQIPVYRSYSPEENTKLSPQARGYLWMLKCRGVIDHALEDEIVDKAMNLEQMVGAKEIKTVAALTVFGYEHKSQVNSGNCDSGGLSRVH